MKDVILVGLGEFGARTVETFNNILDERKYQMPKELVDKVRVHGFVFKGDKSFNYTEVSDRILGRLVDTETHKFNGKFSYVFVGDISEGITAKYGFVYSMLPSIFDQNKIAMKDKDSVLGFFTFSSMLGRQIACGDEKLRAMSSFFRQFSRAAESHSYTPPFKDKSGKPLGEVSCALGPLSRNYIVATPGDQDAVTTMTSQVFAERIFYELFYLSESYKKLAGELQPKRFASPESVFCTFSMIQISRIAELQKYFLKCTLEDRVTDFLLRDGLSGTHLEKFEDNFFRTMDIPTDGEFPIETAVEIFMRNRKGDVTRLFPSYIGRVRNDFRDYVEDCRRKIDETVSKLKDYYDAFATKEIEEMLKTLEQGLTNMFRIDGLKGNINTYIKYVEDLAAKFDGWKDSLRRVVDEAEEIRIEDSIKAVEERVAALQSSALYKIPLFIPVRRMLIESAILSLPLKEYLRSLIKRNIAMSFLVQWSDEGPNSRNPTGICRELSEDLRQMRRRLEEKRSQSKIKRDFIRKLPSFYYIISQMGQEEYEGLLDRIESRNFGPARISDIERAAKNLFNNWTQSPDGEPKDRQEITKDPTGFIKHVDSFMDGECRSRFGEIEPMSESFHAFAGSAVEKMLTLSEQLSKGSFFTEDTTNYLEDRKILVRPETQGDSDELCVLLDDLGDIDDKEDVRNEFTLGSVAYFHDHLYMDYRKLQQYESLFKEFDGCGDEPLSFVDAGEAAATGARGAGTEAEDDELDTAAEYKRAALLDYMTGETRRELYNRAFASRGARLDGEPTATQVNALALALTMDEVFSTMDRDALQDYARDMEIKPRNLPTAAEQIESIKLHVEREAKGR